MSRDTILDPVRAGSVLQHETAAGWRSNTGTVALHNGVPHVAWCEAFDDPAGADVIEQHGPFVAAWTGADWLEIAAPPLPDYVGSAVLQNWPYADLALSCPVVVRGRPLLASDGVNLYCAILGTVMRRVQTNPGSDPPTYLYYAQSFLYGFRLDGDSWTTIGDEIFGLFSELAAVGPYGQLDPIATAISASPDNPGHCYFAFSDHGYESFTQTLYNNLIITGTDLEQTFLVAGAISPAQVTDSHLASRYSLALDGSGPTLALYYQPVDETFDDFFPDTVFVWTLAGDAGSITAADLELGYAARITTPGAFTTAGERYLAFQVFEVITGRADVAIKKVTADAPTALEHIDARRASLDTGTVIQFTERGAGFFAINVFVEPENFWLVAAASTVYPAGPSALFRLDRQCLVLSGWEGELPIGGNSPVAQEFGAGAPGAQGALFDDAFWYFQQDFAWRSSWPDGRLAQVFRTPICRKCAPCPTSGLHLRQRL